MEEDTVNLNMINVTSSVDHSAGVKILAKSYLMFRISKYLFVVILFRW